MKLSRLLKTSFLLICLLGIWYFFIKDYNYKITFKTKQIPGIVYNHILNWNDGESKGNPVVTNFENIPFKEVNQELKSGDTILNLNWEIKKEDDEITFITLKITDPEHSFNQNIQALFGKNGFIKKRISKVKELNIKIDEQSKLYNLSLIEKAQTPSTFCACLPIESKVSDKAKAMVGNITILSDYINDNNIKLAGNPFSEITNWDMENDKIKFNFCFPLADKKNYPEHNKIQFKKIEQRDALKAIFNGNYNMSHLAWYIILDYANTNNISIETSPMEVYLNDPHMGGNALNWSAEVYMPIKN
ncbi:MAG: GyrI-like domain-containing protein [Flavobacteriaceae bacterium]|tara:strand:- start:1140 stop:2048 length:909 start_codon:yes stop_codon:yes gene_type:complete